jgi:hypothetical protein
MFVSYFRVIGFWRKVYSKVGERGRGKKSERKRRKRKGIRIIVESTSYPCKKAKFFAVEVIA